MEMVRNLDGTRSCCTPSDSIPWIDPQYQHKDMRVVVKFRCNVCGKVETEDRVTTLRVTRHGHRRLIKKMLH